MRTVRKEDKAVLWLTLFVSFPKTSVRHFEIKDETIGCGYCSLVPTYFYDGWESGDVSTGAWTDYPTSEPLYDWAINGARLYGCGCPEGGGAGEVTPEAESVLCL